MAARISFLAFGTAFGWFLSRSGAADYDMVQRMFLFDSFQLYGVIGVGIGVGAIGMAILRRRGRTAFGRPLSIPEKPCHRGNVFGGLIFGMGWAIAGMCPGPILVNLGEGKRYALSTMAGMLFGTALFARAYPWLAPRFGLPQVEPAGTQGG